MSDLDRHCAKQLRDLENTITRIEKILSRFPHSAIRFDLENYRQSLIIELHDTSRAHNAYDRRREEALSDATGQDEEAFFDHGESSHGWQSCGGGYMSNGRGGYKENFGG